MPKTLNKLQHSKYHKRIDELEAVMAKCETVNCPVSHRFTKGMYIRETTLLKGAFITSRTHNTNHPFVVTKGKVSVWTENNDEQIIEAPYTGITQPGARRVLFAHEETVWTTFHSTELVTGKENDWSEKHKENLVEKIDQAILSQRKNHVLRGVLKNNKLVKELK